MLVFRDVTERRRPTPSGAARRFRHRRRAGQRHRLRLAPDGYVDGTRAGRLRRLRRAAAPTTSNVGLRSFHPDDLDHHAAGARRVRSPASSPASTASAKTAAGSTSWTARARARPSGAGPPRHLHPGRDRTTSPRRRARRPTATRTSSWRPGPRAAQPAGADPQRPAGPPAGGRQPRGRRGPGHHGAAARAHGAAGRRPARRVPHQPRQDRAAPGPARRLAGRRDGARDQPAPDRGRGPRAVVKLPPRASGSTPT